MLNQEERDLLAKKIIECAFYFGKTDLAVESVTQTINVFENIFSKTLQEYLDGFNLYMRDSKNRTYPSPAMIKPYLEKELDDDSRAMEAASRAIAAVSKFGYTNPVEAKSYIGELGWAVIERFGGWQYVCENLGDSLQVTTFQAQVRDIARSINKTLHIGQFDSPVNLNSSKPEQVSLSDRRNDQVKALLTSIKLKE